MKRQNYLYSLIAGVLALVLSIVSAPDTMAQGGGIVYYPDVVYMNATIVTLDDHEMNSNPGTIVQAMALLGDTIVALGTNQEMQSLIGPDTKVVDLQGKTVIPGFIESHVHPQGPAEQFARELFNLRSSPEGYALSITVGRNTDETMAKVASAMKVLLENVEPTADDWINISLVHSPEMGYAIPASVSTLMTSRRMSDVKIAKSDITEIVPDYKFILSSATSIMDAPEAGVWYHITVGSHGEAIYTAVVDFE